MPTRVEPMTTTAEQLFSQPADGYRYQLVAGELQMKSPVGGRHGRVAYRMAQILGNYVDANQLGVVFAAETGFLIEQDPDTVLAPDVAFVSRNRYEEVRSDEVKYLPLAPDLVVEVLSPGDRFTRVESKAFRWLDAGSKIVLAIDPETQRIHAYRSRKQIEVFESHETIDCGGAVDQWTFKVSDVFRLY